MAGKDVVTDRLQALGRGEGDEGWVGDVPLEKVFGIERRRRGIDRTYNPGRTYEFEIGTDDRLDQGYTWRDQKTTELETANCPADRLSRSEGAREERPERYTRRHSRPQVRPRSGRRPCTGSRPRPT